MNIENFKNYCKSNYKPPKIIINNKEVDFVSDKNNIIKYTNENEYFIHFGQHKDDCIIINKEQSFQILFNSNNEFFINMIDEAIIQYEKFKLTERD